VLELLAGPLHAFGFVDLSPSVDDVRAIRLRQYQDVHWGRVTEIPYEATATLNPETVRLVAGTGTGDAVSGRSAFMEVVPPVPPAFMSFALSWSQPAGYSRNLVRYELRADRLHQVFEGGESPESLSKQWEAAVGFEPPPEVLSWWRYWWDRYGRMRLYPVQALLETRDAFTLQEVQAAVPQFQRAVLGLVAPNVALLDPQEVDNVFDALTRQGYMPKVSSS
jgi:hypothetical protein